MRLPNIFCVLVFICAILLTAGCSLVGDNENTNVPQSIDFSTLSQDTTLLVGTWEWTRSTYYYTESGMPTIQTPSSTGRTETLVFTQDDTVEVYRNGELFGEITYQEYLDRGQWGVRDDLFATSTAHVDGPESVYVRAE